MGAVPRHDHYRLFTRVDAVEATPRGLLARLHGETLHVDLVAEDVVRLTMSRAGVVDPQPTHALAVDPLAGPAPAFEVEHAGTGDPDDTGAPGSPGTPGGPVVRLRTAALVVTLGLDPFRLDVHRADGSPVVETATDEAGRPWAYATLNDAFVVRRRCRPQDAVYGLGEKTGTLDRRGRDFTLWNTDVLSPDAAGAFEAEHAPDHPRADRTSTEFDPYYVSIPFFHHQDAATGAIAGSFVDNAHRAAYDFTADDHYTMWFAGGQYTEYVFAGPAMPDVLRGYTALTGRTAVPPLWALGYHQCRWFAYSQDALEQLGRRHREAGIPCDALWLDIDHMDGYRVFTWDPDRFPDPAGMLARLAQDGFRVITIVDPGVKHDPGYRVYDDAVARDVLCRTEGGEHYVGQVWPGDTVFPDFATPEARAWWGALNAEHVRSGLAGIWNDMNEPATGEIAPEAMLFDRGRASHARYHNQYALLMAMGTTEGLLAAMPDRRTFVLSRAGSAGIQRYAANWMGDNFARWDHLWLSMPMAAGLGLSGQAFVGADVGGFAEDTHAELLVRWTQYGALTPFFRNHSMAGTVDQYAWSFGEADQKLIGEAVRLRYLLLPYLYACFLRAAETGAPVQRPLVFDFQHDPAVRDLDDQYLLGPDLLVAPVVEPGVTSRPVYLPEGTWVDWYTGEAVVGPRRVVAAAPVDRIPLYARGGAVLPMWGEAPASTAGHHPATVELHLVVPAEDGSWTSFLQEDDGLTFAERDGARLRTAFAVTRAGERVTVRGTVEGDGYPEHARTALRLVVRGATPADVTLDGRPLAADGFGGYRFANAGEGFELRLTVG